jgi:hypothetical protein
LLKSLFKKKQESGNKEEFAKNKRCLLLTSDDFPIKVTVVPKGMLVRPQELIIDIQPK